MLIVLNPWQTPRILASEEVQAMQQSRPDIAMLDLSLNAMLDLSLIDNFQAWIVHARSFPPSPRLYNTLHCIN
jgi:DNA-binding NarL/FixJ family response regulator